MAKKYSFTIFIFLLLAFLFYLPQQACATSVSVSVSGNRGVVTVTAEAQFDTDPETGQTGGTVSCTNGGTKHYWDSSGTITGELDTTTVPAGTPITIMAGARSDCNKTTAEDSITIIPDNVPDVSVSGGTMRGVSSISVDYSFPSSGAGVGEVVLYIDSARAGGSGYISVSYYEETSGSTDITIDSTYYANGTHPLEAYASLVWGNSVGIASASITTDNAPRLSISGSKKLRGEANVMVDYSFPSTTGGAAGVNVVLESDGYQVEIGHSGYIATSSTSEAAGQFSFSFDTTKFADGSYTLKIYGGIIGRSRCSGMEQSSIVIANAEPEIKPPQEVPKTKVAAVAEPISVADGNMFTTATDILIPAREIPLELSRTYNSQDDFIGAFGYGWRSNYDIRLEEQLDESVIELDGEGVYTIYTKNPDGSYTPSTGKYAQLTKNPDGTFTILRKHGRKLHFDSTGKLVEIEERNGNVLQVSYNAGVISEVTDSVGRRLIFTSDSAGKIAQVEDPAGRIFNYEYDTEDNLITLTEPLGKQTTYEYDSNHNLIQQTDANGNSVYFEYDDSDRAYHSWQDGNNNEVTLSFDFDNNTTTSTDSLGNITVYEYNDYGLVTKITDAQNNIRQISWDDALNRTSFSDENGNSSFFTYDVQGNLLTIKDSLNNTTTFTYEPNFNLVGSITDRLGHTTEFAYDIRGNLVKVTDALSNKTVYIYDSLGQLVQLEDTKGNQAHFAYDSFGNLERITDALGNETLFSYDIIGNLTQLTDAKGNITAFSYDLLNRLTEIIYPDGSKIAYSYDAEENLTSVTDPNNNSTSYTYDEVNRLIEAIDALGNTSTSFYDTEGNRITVTDAKGNTINYAYDSLYRLISIVYPDSSQVSFGYDAAGNRISMSDSFGQTFYSYDALNRLVEVDGSEDNDTITYSYDAAGKRIALTNQNGDTTTYSYDTLNRLVKLTGAQGKETTYNYDEVSNLVKKIYPNNTQTNYSYDNLNRLTKLVNKRPIKIHPRYRPRDKIISSYKYDYDPDGMRAKAILKGGSYIEYTYDVLNRLTKEAKYNKRGRLHHSCEYAYDAVGNRLSLVRTFLRRKFWTNYTYNAGNQLTQEQKGIERHGRNKELYTISYTHDGNGNLKEGKVEFVKGLFRKGILTTYDYDYENRLTKITYRQHSKRKTASNSEYEYDGVGKRITSIEEGQVTRYLYDGLTAIIERDENNQTIASYTGGLSYPGGIGGIISRTTHHSQPKTYYYHYDGLGSVTRLTDSKGMPIQYYSYDAFGNILNLSYYFLSKKGKDTNPYLFSTKEYNPRSELIYFGARYYNPRIGRWLTPDPLGMTDGPNLYAYVGNNPVNWIDPYGSFTWPYTWKGWGGVILTGAGVVSLAAPIPGAQPAGWGMIVTGTALSIWDLVEGFSQSERWVREQGKEILKQRIKAYSGATKELQEIGLLPSNEKLKRLGFTKKDMKDLDLK